MTPCTGRKGAGLPSARASSGSARRRAVDDWPALVLADGASFLGAAAGAAVLEPMSSVMRSSALIAMMRMRPPQVDNEGETHQFCCRADVPLELIQDELEAVAASGMVRKMRTC